MWQLSSFEQQLIFQNLDTYYSLNIVSRYMYWNVIVEEDEKFEMVQDTVYGAKRYAMIAWVFSFIWCAWCLAYVLVFLFSADTHLDPETGEQLLNAEDFMIAFAVGLFFDFVICTPIIIFIHTVILPIFVVWILGGQVSASFTSPNTANAYANPDDEADGSKLSVADVARDSKVPDDATSPPQGRSRVESIGQGQSRVESIGKATSPRNLPVGDLSADFKVTTVGKRRKGSIAKEKRRISQNSTGKGVPGRVSQNSTSKGVPVLDQIK